MRRGVAFVLINRPEKLNTLNREATTALLVAVVKAAEDPAIDAVVFRGAGSKAFCAGGDLKEIAQDDVAGTPFPIPMTGLHRNLFEAVLETYKPTIAVLNGDAYGMGGELCLACDIRIAADHARFGLPEARRGTGANFGSVLLPRIIPRGIALEMLYTGESLTAAEAAHWGLFNRIVPADELDSVVEQFVDTITGNAPLTVRRCKEVATKGWELPVAAALRLHVGPNAYHSADRVEGIRAFVEQREARWSGR